MDDPLNIIGLLALISYSNKRNVLVFTALAAFACAINIIFYDTVTAPDAVFALVYGGIMVISMASAATIGGE